MKHSRAFSFASLALALPSVLPACLPDESTGAPNSPPASFAGTSSAGTSSGGTAAGTAPIGGGSGSGGVANGGGGGDGGSNGGTSGAGGGSGSGGDPISGSGSGGSAGAASDGPFVCEQSTIDESMTGIATAAGTSPTGTWTSPSGLSGSAYAYPSTFKVDGLGASGPIAMAEYAGFGLTFNKCVKATTLTGVKFSLKATGVTKVKCFVDTWATSPIDKTYKKGSCAGAAGVTCVSPGKDVTISEAETAVTLSFAELAGKGVPSEDAAAIAANLAAIGCSWQASAAGPVELELDEVEFTK